MKYSTIQSHIKKRTKIMIPNECMQENPRINQQDRQMIVFHGSANPKEISQLCTPATHTEAVHCQRVLLGDFHRCLWPLKAPGSTFWGRVAKPVISSLTPVHPTALLLFSLGSSLPKCLDQCTVNKQETQLKWVPLELGTGAGDQKH